MASAKSWSYKAGEKGRNRVRVYEDAKAGKLLLEYYETAPGDPNPKRRRLALGHCDRERAKRQADEVAAKLGQGWSPDGRGITLGALFDNYLREVTSYKSPSKERHDRAAAEMFMRFFGRERRAKTLNIRDWNRFIRERRNGKIAPAGRRKPSGVRNRQIEYDLSFLRAVLNWASSACNRRGEPFLERNPLDGLPLPRELNPRRPLTSKERYRAMLAVAPKVDWRCEIALVLTYETGRRIGAVRQLRWADVDLEDLRIRWREESDKIGLEKIRPITAEAAAVLRKARLKSPGIGDAWVLPSPRDPSKPCSRHLAGDWWLRMEKMAELEHVSRLGWHGNRREFATDLMEAEVPIKMVCELGGWKNPQTLLTCYQHPDEEQLRSGLAKRRRAAGSAG
jgi:integrase